MINHFTEGNNRTKNRLNEIVNSANTADNLSRRLKREILNRIPRRQGGGGEGSTIQLVYCKEDAGDSRSITGYMGYDELNVRVWLATTTYIVDDKVTYDNKLWRSLNAANLNHTPAEDAYWTEITDYNEETEYAADDWTLYRNKLWRCKTTSTGDVPQEGTYWTTKAKAYAAGTAYVIGNRVTYSGILWRCTQGGTGQTPAAESAYWSEIEEIEVYCNIACGNSLQFAFPRLLEQQEIAVSYNSARARYEAATLFQACEETAAEGGMLEMSNNFMTYDMSNSSGSAAVAFFGGSGLTFHAAANSTYVIEIQILAQGTDIETASPGISLGVTLPASIVSFGGYFVGEMSGGSMAALGLKVAYTSAMVTFTRNEAGIKLIDGKFILQTGETAGQFGVLFNNNVAGTSFIMMGSSIKWRRTQWSVQQL